VEFGHWNLLLPGAGDVFQFEKGMTPVELHAYAREHSGVLIPHHVAKDFGAYNWEYFDSKAEPVVEMCSLHGIFESKEGNVGRPDMVPGRFIEDGLARGYQFGFVAASDFHNCFAALAKEWGLTGIYARELTEPEIYRAIWKRRTFATTGSRIVVDFRCNGRMMGEEVRGADSLVFEGRVTSSDSIKSVEIVSGKRIIFRKDAAQPDVRFSWATASPDSKAYYYLRAVTSRNDMAWSSPIWAIPAE
jgi:hypothetical protein